MDVGSNRSPADAPSAGFRYPTEPPGIPAFEAGELLLSHRDLMDRIKLCFGMDRAAFEQSVLPLLQRYAAYVHLLPCTADNYFSEAGGLLRIGLETAFFALQGADAHIFSGRATITERRDLEPRWRMATFIGGLCCELHRPLNCIRVTDEAGNEWQPYLGPLAGWLRERQLRHYFLKWRPDAIESRALGLFALPHVIGAATLRELAVGNSQIVPHLLAAIAGIPVYRDRNVLETLVRRSLALVIERFLLTDAQRHGKPQLGAHLERYFVDALRRLAASNPGWTPNADKSRVWHGADGLFLVWPAGADDIRKLLEADQLPGIPRTPETILDVLHAAGILAARDDSVIWRIHPPGGKAQAAVKLSAPAILYAESDDLPSALPQPLAEPSALDSACAPACAPGMAEDAGAPDAAPAATRSPARQFTLPGLPEARPAKKAAAPQPDPPAAKPPAPILPPAPEPEAPRLLAPLRLPMLIRDALAAIVATLAGSQTEWEASPMEEGLFVPLAILADHKIAPPAAIRALGEAGMLAEPASLTRAFREKEVVGILIDKRHVAGWPALLQGQGNG
ncbi:MAG: TraI domain-containing protein [Desulfovibrionaceae bacterium]|nr:TraI domain-containing protein [Desulfovibrionaceae bacterium]